jgi:tripartite-type tricarboxylate transporter receptor subunit TctC
MFNKIIAVLLLSIALSAQAQKPIKIVIPFSPGGAVDTTNRILHAALERELNQQIGVESRPGAAGQIGLRHIAQNKSNEVLITFIDAIALANVIALDVQVELEDFKYLNQIGRSSGIALIVKKGSPLKDLNYWRTHKGKPISIGSNGFGGAHHFYSWTLNNQVAFPRTDVFFKGINEALPMVIGGHMDAMWGQVALIEGYERDGKIDVVVATSKGSSNAFATFKEFGVDAPTTRWIVISNQTTDTDTVKNIEATINRLLSNSEFVKSLQVAGIIPEPGLTSQSKSSTIQALQQQRKFVEYVKSLK